MSQIQHFVILFGGSPLHQIFVDFVHNIYQLSLHIAIGHGYKYNALLLTSVFNRKFFDKSSFDVSILHRKTYINQIKSVFYM